MWSKNQQQKKYKNKNKLTIKYSFCRIKTWPNFFFRFKSSRIKTLESVDVRTSNNELSLSDYRDQDLEEREYHYVSYDEISKRGSYEKKSPSQSYVYDVTWL